MKRWLPFLFALLALPLAGEELPPLNSPATDTACPGKFIWADLFTSDQAAAERFYAGLFNWTSAEVERQTSSGTRSYLIMSNGGRPIAGIALRPKKLKEEARGRWVGYVSVPDVAAALAKARSLGGRVIFPARDLAQRGTQAIFCDAEGAMLGVMHSSSGDPGEYLADDGDWVWAEHFTRDPAAALRFDQGVLAYESAPDDRTPKPGDFLLSSGGYARASVAPMPAKARAHAAWLLYVRVPDVEKAVAKVASLGGEIRVKPRQTEPGMKLAVVRDPDGAAIGLIELTGSESPSDKPLAPALP